MARISEQKPSTEEIEEKKVDRDVEVLERLKQDRRPKQSGYVPTTEEEKRLDKAVNLKMDLIIISVCAIDFLLQGIDKSNVGNAATRSFEKDANLSKNDIPDSISLLSATFVTLQPISVYLGRRVGPKYWVPFVMSSWGAVCMGHAGITNRGQLLALRLLLGAFEAGFVPLCFYYLSTLYPHYILGLRIGLFAGMFAISGAFSSLIAYGIFHIKSGKYKDWQILFLLEGGVTILFALVTLLALPKNIGSAWFLTPEEREHAVRRLKLDRPELEEEAQQHVQDKNVKWINVKDALTDWKKLVLIACNICATLPVYVFGVFMPLIVKGMGYSGLDANKMSISPFMVGAVGLFLFVYLSDRYRERSLFIIIAITACLVGFIVMSVSTNQKLRYGFVHVALSGAATAGPLMATWLTDNTPDQATRSVVIGINGWSNLAGVITGQLFKGKYGPRYHKPLVITTCLLSAGLAGFIVMRFVYVWENRRRVKLVSSWSEEEIQMEKESTERRGDRKLTFIYGT